MVNNAGPFILIALQLQPQDTGDPIQSRIGQDGGVVETGGNGETFLSEGLLQVPQGPFALRRLQLVGQHQAHIRPFGPIQGQVQNHRVNHTADPAAGHQQHRRTQQLGHPGIAQADRRPHPAVPRPLDH